MNFSLYLVFVLPSEEFPTAGLRWKRLNSLLYIYLFWDGEWANIEVLKTVCALKLSFFRDLQGKQSLKSAVLIFMNLLLCFILSCNNFGRARMMELNKVSGNKPPRRGRWLVAFLWAAAEVNYFMAASVTVTQPAGLSRKKKIKKKTHKSGEKVTIWIAACVFLSTQCPPWRKKYICPSGFYHCLSCKQACGALELLPAGYRVATGHNRGTHNHCLLTSHTERPDWESNTWTFSTWGNSANCWDAALPPEVPGVIATRAPFSCPSDGLERHGGRNWKVAAASKPSGPGLNVNRGL